MAKKPVLLCIMDGFGWVPEETFGNAVVAAKKPHLDALMAKYPMTTINASGMAVGLPEGQMGNSEVGHTNMGAGRIVYQQLTLITKSIHDGEMLKNPVLVKNMKAAIEAGKAIHLMGLVGTGGVHSHADHWFGQGNIWKRINFRGIMMTSLPAFIAMALCLACSKIPGCEKLSDVFDTLVNSIPIVICAIAAKQVSGLDEVGVVGGIVAGILSVDGGILGGLVIGILAGVLAYYISVFCFRHNVPGTTVNIASGGLGGLAAGLVGKFLIAPVALWIGNGICSLINLCIAYNSLLAGAVAGLLIWPAIIGGVYHAAILPIVLLEMEEMGFSFLGAIDMTGLVMVSAGITLANVIMPKQKGEAAVALPGCIINICFGTFVEASYPFMFSNKIVFAGALASATVGGAIVGLFNVKGTAYVPAVLAPFMANEGKGLAFVVAMIAAMGCAFVVTMVANMVERRKKEALLLNKQQ